LAVNCTGFSFSKPQVSFFFQKPPFFSSYGTIIIGARESSMNLKVYPDGCCTYYGCIFSADFFAADKEEKL
jgi:hypothetical protein